MRKADIKDATVDAAKNASLKSIWFERIGALHQSITKKSSLECATRCTARCCPKARSISGDEKAVGHVAIMLPFEREYILSQDSVKPELLASDRVAFTAGTTVNIGFMTREMPCPFLTDANQCGIYDIRPLDCRSFPLIPVFHEDDAISFRVDETCPSASTFSVEYQEELKGIWTALMPLLPMSYRRLYNAL